MTVLEVNFSVANNFGKIKAKLKNKGSFIGDFDIINAAFALTYSFTLVTRNTKHNEKVEGVKIKGL